MSAGPADPAPEPTTTANTSQSDPDDDLYEDTTKARPAHTGARNTPNAIGAQGSLQQVWEEGAFDSAHSTQHCFRKRQKERRINGITQERHFDHVQERTPRRGLGQPKGQGPYKHPDLGGRQQAKPGSSKPFYILKPAPAQRPANITEDKRPPGKTPTHEDLDEEGSEVANPKEERNKRVLIYLSKAKAPPSGSAKGWKDEMRRRITQTVEKELGIKTTIQ